MYLHSTVLPKHRSGEVISCASKLLKLKTGKQGWCPQMVYILSYLKPFSEHTCSPLFVLFLVRCKSVNHFNAYTRTTLCRPKRAWEPKQGKQTPKIKLLKINPSHDLLTHFETSSSYTLFFMPLSTFSCFVYQLRSKRSG